MESYGCATDLPPSVPYRREEDLDKVPMPSMVFKVASEHARELAEWSKRSFKSNKRFGPEPRDTRHYRY